MERRLFLKRTGTVSAVGAALASPAVIQAQQALRWRLASSFPKSLDTIYGGAETFSRKLSEITGGRFQISVHAAGELVPAFGVVDAVEGNTVECAHTAPYYFFGKDPTFALDAAIPFGLNSRQMNAWMFNGNGMKLMREFYANYNIVNFPMGNTGAQMGGWYRREIQTVADIKGLKMRIGGFGGRVLEAIGGVPQNIPGGEIYSSLERGTIDAVEWVGPYDDEKLGFYKVAPFYYYPAWWEVSTQLSLYISSKAYEGLSAENKAAIDAASAFAHVEMQAKYDAQNPDALKRLVANGTRLRAMPQPITQAAFDAAQGVYADLNANNPAWRKIYADYKAFQSDLVAWFRFSENSMDAFMSRALR